MQWLQARKSVPTIRALRDHAERLRRHEVERAARALARGDDPTVVLEALSHGITNKFLHAPTAALHGADAEERERLVTLLSRLYSIPREE
jgi:glutamyl-tRNA reductase